MFKRTLTAVSLGLLLLPGLAAAQDFTSTLDDTGTAVYGSPDNADFFETLGLILNIVLSVLGVALLVLFIYAGFLWMTAAGNDQRVAKAKGILLNAIIGMLILVSSYAISAFVVSQLSAVGGP